MTFANVVIVGESSSASDEGPETKFVFLFLINPRVQVSPFLTYLMRHKGTSFDWFNTPLNLK